MTPSGFDEELALELAAVVEHSERQAIHWRNGNYAAALEERAAVEAALAHIRVLEEAADTKEKNR